VALIVALQHPQGAHENVAQRLWVQQFVYEVGQFGVQQQVRLS
jgi:hypothetical protein